MPNNLGKLTNLRTLAIGHKLVKAIPEPVLQLTGLEELAITYCKLQRLPSNLAAMQRLRCLNLQGNPWLQAGRCSAPCPSDACILGGREATLLAAKVLQQCRRPAGRLAYCCWKQACLWGAKGFLLRAENSGSSFSSNARITGPCRHYNQCVLDLRLSQAWLG